LKAKIMTSTDKTTVTMKTRSSLGAAVGDIALRLHRVRQDHLDPAGEEAHRCRRPEGRAAIPHDVDGGRPRLLVVFDGFLVEGLAVGLVLLVDIEPERDDDQT
jgi:hypothetical protein